MSEVFHHYLSEDYELYEYDVYCGRGIRCLQHVGNRHFRSLIESMRDRYACAGSKQDKIGIITEVVRQFRALGGGFLRQDIENGRYYEIGDHLAKEKVSQAFRDTLRVMNRQSKGEENANIDFPVVSLTTELGGYESFSRRHTARASGHILTALFNEGPVLDKICHRRD